MAGEAWLKEGCVEGFVCASVHPGPGLALVLKHVSVPKQQT